MTFDEYQFVAEQFAQPNHLGRGVIVLEKIKKLHRDHGGVVTPHLREEIKKELGDVLWYLSALASDFDIFLCDVAEANVKKLAGRKARGTLGGSGDNR